jgi:hypothetical protein
MMNRVFDPENTIEIGADGGDGTGPGHRTSSAQPADPSTAATQAHSKADPQAPAPGAAASSSRRHDQTLLLITALTGVGLVSAASSIFYVSHWNRLQQSLSQERNLLLVERLRNLGPATASPLAAPMPSAPTLPQPSPGAPAAGPSADGLPPPPPEEPWIQQLSNLPNSGQPNAGQPPMGNAAPGLLRVPISPQVKVAPPEPALAATPRPVASSGPLPQLVGVVGVAGKSASAIFLLNGAAMSVGTGETIGASGWKLRTADGETALIEKGGDVRQVSIINGF